ncbi:MAG: S1/P1 nuclease [Pseudomonadota bacterium]
MKKLAIVATLCAAFVSVDALAWGNDGHRVVGAIADKLIVGTHAQQQVAALLLPGESLESVANWADCVKGTYCGPQTPEMQAYVSANAKHNEYHYADIPFQSAHYEEGAVGSNENDIVHIMRQAIAALQGKDDDASNPHHFTKRQALMVLTHLAGDIHQPLHVGAAYVGKDGKFVAPAARAQVDTVNVFDSRGGNSLLLDDEKLNAASAGLIPPREADPKAPPAAAPKQVKPPKPFHSYWDSTVVDYAMRRIGAKTPEQFARLVIDTKPEVAANSGDPQRWPEQWANEALQVSKLAYADLVPGKIVEQTGKKGDIQYTWGLDLPPNYPVPSSALAKTQLIKGGYHLAALLEAIWP